ncbi:Para-hydroxybenzoate--polyprenyltransferase, mitochondrial precursor (PHB:polyprenyltransferase) [Diatrype stigma]|uniref:4-hydroxybenzoate polyprenyltransferase, mitochondrial n=1 Tax=Diatrype stigma TaxID=117547 RepID=A0AAN9UQJ7_9PEZI
MLIPRSLGPNGLRQPVTTMGCLLRTHHAYYLRAPPAPYTPPTTGILARLPTSWVPYAELLRIDKPTGTYYLFLPCLFSTLLAAPLSTPSTPPLTVLGTSALFLAGAFIMRGAGCAINDLWDRNLDPRVRRTRHRPVARGAVTPFQALTFVGANLLAGLAVLLQFPPVCLLYGVPSLLLVATYPLAKRVTYYPQFVLGLTFSWGALMGFPALGIDFLGAAPAAQALLGVDAASFLGLGTGVAIDPATTAAATTANNANPLAAAALLYSSNVAWTVLYDMIYAHMDLRDDAKAGIKSIALAHASPAKSKRVLTLLAGVQVTLLAGAGVAAGAGPAFFVGSCGGAALTLGWMIRRVRLDSVRDCWWWFVNGCWITGGVIASGLGADYGLQYLEAQKAHQANRKEHGDDDTKANNQ